MTRSDVVDVRREAGARSGVVVELSRTIAPGRPAGRLVGEAAERGAHAGSSAAAFGLAAAFTTATLAMAQVERSTNRIAGLREDRPPVLRYVVAALLAATVGVLLGVGGLLLGTVRAIASGVGWADEARSVWSVARWPVGLIVVALGVFLSIVALLLWSLLTSLALHLGVATACEVAASPQRGRAGSRARRTGARTKSR